MDFDIGAPRVRALARLAAPARLRRRIARRRPFGPRDLARGPPPHRPRLQRLPSWTSPPSASFRRSCGPLRRLARAPPRDGASRFLATSPRQDAARAALALRDVTIIDRTIRIHPTSVPEFEPPRRRARHSGRRRRRRRAPRRRRRRRRPVRDARRETRAPLVDSPPRTAARMDPLELYRAARELLPSYFSAGSAQRVVRPVPHLVLAARRARRRESPRRATTM